MTPDERRELRDAERKKAKAKVKKLEEAGVLGVISSAKVPINATYNRDVKEWKSWDDLPVTCDIKMDEHQFAEILLVGSSANRTGEAPPRNVQELSEELTDMVDVVLDGGESVRGIPSTIVDLTSDEPKILREGPISPKAIFEALTLSN